MNDVTPASREMPPAGSEADRTATVLRALVETTSDPVLVLDLDGTVRSWNPACEALFGWSAAEVIGSVLPFVAHGRRPTAVKNIRRDASAGGVAVREVSGLRKDGSRVGARATLVPLSGADGLPWGILQIVRTVESDSRVERLQGEFVSLVSQELKNPLTAILGFVQLLGRPEILDDPMKRRATLHALEARGRQMASLVDDLLLASDVQEGRLRLEREPVDLARLVTEAVRRFEQLQTGRRFVIDVDTRMPCAEVDPRRVGQALDNLIANALKYAPDGDRVSIGVVQDDEEAVVSVTDNGPGLSPEIAERIFDRFFTSPVPGAASQGTGLGLFLVRTIAEAHGGTVGVDSHPGRGSTFTLRLPLAVS